MLRTVLLLGCLLGSTSHASAQTPTGYDVAPAEYEAAPAEYEAAPPAADRALSPGQLRVRFTGAPDGVMLHHAQGTCVSPCELTLSPDMHRFGLSMGDGDIADANPVLIDRSGQLRGEFERRSGRRTSGWVMFGVAGSLSVLTGVGGVLGVATGDFFFAALGVLGLIISGVHLILALAVGVPLASVGDGARVRFN
ncbi:MAG: hypothetical protein AB8I08_32670 [Sandaracinaceae bacterium]